MKVVAISLIAAGIALAPTARADTDADYLDAMHQNGAAGINGDQGLIDTAHNICSDLDSGTTKQVLSVRIGEQNPNLRPEQISLVMNRAEQYYCPWHFLSPTL